MTKKFGLWPTRELTFNWDKESEWAMYRRRMFNGPCEAIVVECDSDCCLDSCRDGTNPCCPMAIPTYDAYDQEDDPKAVFRCIRNSTILAVVIWAPILWAIFG